VCATKSEKSLEKIRYRVSHPGTKADDRNFTGFHWDLCTARNNEATVDCVIRCGIEAYERFCRIIQQVPETLVFGCARSKNDETSNSSTADEIRTTWPDAWLCPSNEPFHLIWFDISRCLLLDRIDGVKLDLDSIAIEYFGA
jgi:hypothetical protein